MSALPHAAVLQPRFPAPSDDKRWRIVNATMRRHGFSAGALIEVLHTVQDTFGYIDKPALLFVARNLQVPLSKAFGVATFYNYFRLRPPGEHTCEVCYGTACYIQGASGLSDAVREVAGVAPGETSDDGKVSLSTVRCLGCCSNAPVAVFDGTVCSLMTADDVRAQIETWQGKRKVTVSVDASAFDEKSFGAVEPQEADTQARPMAHV